MSFDLACLGRAAIDLYGEQIGLPLEDVSTFARYLGGSPANTAVGASRLGLRVAMITRVGDEQNGRFVRETLAREGVDVSQVSTDPQRLTALVFLAIRGRDDFPHVFYRDRCADMALAPEHIDAAFLARCKALLVSGTHLSQETPTAACERAVSAAREAGARVILDIDYRPVLWGLAGHAEGARRYAASEAAAARYARLLPACDLVVGTEEEFHVAGGSANLLEALARVRTLTKALLVVKLGAQGCLAFRDDVLPSHETAVSGPGFPVEVFNALGAGDAFMAGFLRGWLRDEPIADCCRYANACGALVVSRHGCAPAMPTGAELAHFLANGVTTPRLREDRELEHLHRATTRRRVPRDLHVLAFDHRTQLEALAGSGADAPARIAQFKALVAEAFVRVSRKRGSGGGAIVDERHGSDVLARLTGHGFWIARPVEAPGVVPLAFEAGDEIGLALRSWPAEHAAKCLVQFHPDDPEALRDSQLQRLRALASACAATRRELLVEVIPPARSGNDANTVGRALEAIYAAGVRPDWWKLPPSPQAAAWKAIHAAIVANDPLCRGVLVLGMEAGNDALAESFRAATASPRVKGFAVGRSIFGEAAEEWFAHRWDDERVVAEVARRYEEVIALWNEARTPEMEDA